MDMYSYGPKYKLQVSKSPHLWNYNPFMAI